MDVMGIVVTLVIGGLIGWVSSILMGTNAQMGVIANIIVGIVGSMVGFWLAPKLGIASAENKVVPWLVAIGGACVLLLVLKLLGIFK